MAPALAAATLLVGSGPVAAQTTDSTEVCTEGRIGDIRVSTNDVFPIDEDSNILAKGFFGFMNAVHVKTHPGFIRRQLLFREGDCLDPFLLSESQRLIRNLRFIGPVSIYPEEMQAGQHRVFVDTRDEWSTQFDLGASYDQGFNLEVLELTEENFLGRGLYLEGEFRSYRERRDLSARLWQQRFLGRMDASIQVGSSRAGNFLNQYVTHPFLGEVGRWAGREAYQHRTQYFRYATDGAEPFTHVLLPVTDERLELSGAHRVGRPGRYYMVGGSLTRDVFDFRTQELVMAGRFGEAAPDTLSLASEILGQVRPIGATRASIHLASRRVHFREYRGLDALQGVRDVELGVDVGLSVGKSFGLLEPDDPAIRVPDDWLFRGRFRAGAPAGESLVLANAMIESRWEDGDWRDVLAETDLWLYGRASWLPYQTFWARAAYVGGIATSMPYQLTVGGRDGVRSLRDDKYPAGHTVIFTLEDRIYEGWPNWRAMDLGLTLFADVGRGWAGDVPYGTDSSWHTALGVGLRLGLPSGTSNVMRWDLAFPLEGGGPVFRVTVFERHGLRFGPSEDLLRRSRRFDIGPEYFN